MNPCLRHSAVQSYRLSADPFGIVAGQEGYYFGDIFRLADAVKSIQRSQSVDHFLRFAFGEQFSIGRTGQYGIDIDASLTYFLGKYPG